MGFFQHTQSIQHLNVVSQSITSEIGLDLRIPFTMSKTLQLGIPIITHNQTKVDLSSIRWIFLNTICPAPCEGACVVGLVDDPVPIKNIEYSIIYRAFEM
eukprot:110475_1